MRYLGILLLAASPLFAQPAESDPRVLQSLLSEVQQLRLAIERSTLLGARTQLAISQVQLQETKVEKLSKELADLREANTRSRAERINFAESIRELESRRSDPTAKGRENLEGAIQHSKLRLEEIVAQEPRRAAREGELASQLQAAERALADSRNRIGEMQRSLDAAIQQILKPR